MDSETAAPIPETTGTKKQSGLPEIVACANCGEVVKKTASTFWRVDGHGCCSVKCAMQLRAEVRRKLMQVPYITREGKTLMTTGRHLQIARRLADGLTITETYEQMRTFGTKIEKRWAARITLMLAGKDPTCPDFKLIYEDMVARNVNPAEELRGLAFRLMFRVTQVTEAIKKPDDQSAKFASQATDCILNLMKIVTMIDKEMPKKPPRATKVKTAHQGFGLDTNEPKLDAQEAPKETVAEGEE